MDLKINFKSKYNKKNQKELKKMPLQIQKDIRNKPNRVKQYYKCKE